jgi:hypothetical protein
MQTMVDRDVPERSVAQRMAALEIGNRYRSYRAALKIRIRRGEEDARTFLCDPPVEMASMRVVELLAAIPKVGKKKVDRMLMLNHVSPSKTLAGLTDRQRAVLTEAISPYCGRANGKG